MFISKTKLLMAVLVVALVVPAAAYANDAWSDVENGKFYHDAVTWAKGNGMTTGCNGGTGFCPDRVVTRGENITFAKRYDDLNQVWLADIQADADAAQADADTNATNIGTNTAAAAAAQADADTNATNIGTNTAAVAAAQADADANTDDLGGPFITVMAGTELVASSMILAVPDSLLYRTRSAAVTGSSPHWDALHQLEVPYTHNGRNWGLVLYSVCFKTFTGTAELSGLYIRNSGADTYADSVYNETGATFSDDEGCVLTAPNNFEGAWDPLESLTVELDFAGTGEIRVERMLAWWVDDSFFALSAAEQNSVLESQLDSFPAAEAEALRQGLSSRGALQEAGESSDE